MTRSFGAAAALVVMLFAAGVPASLRAQRQGGPPPASGRATAPIDLTGYWVSYVTENWRYRMVTPAKGEYRRIPASPAALPIINAWDPAADERAGDQCKSFGAGAIMSVPGRLHITWQDANTLRIDTDAGQQTRLLRFTNDAPAVGRALSGAPPSNAPAASAGRGVPAPPSPTWQGESTARWERVAAPDRGGSLSVVTSRLRAGYLRKNGVPYSDRATVSEQFDVAPLPDGGELLLVMTTVADPVYLTGPYIVSPHFKKEPDGSKWDPRPCSSTW